MSGYAYTPWIWPMVASAGFIGIVGLYLWRRRETQGALPLALVAFVTALWCLANAAEISATDFDLQYRWFVLRDALALPGVMTALWFGLEYAGFGRLLTRPVVAVLVGSLIAHLPFYVIDDGRLYWTRVWWDGGVRADLAPLGALFTIYGFALFLIVTAVFVVLFVKSPAHRLPVALILIGQVSVRVAYPLGALNIAHLPNVPLVILAFDFAMLMYAIALFRFRMFEVVPVARQTIIDRMPDAMFVLDGRGRVADLNAAAARLVGIPRSAALRRSPAVLLDRFPELARRIEQVEASSDDVEMVTPDGPRRYQVRSTGLTDWHGQPIGRLVMVHDLTELRLAQERLLEHERALAIGRERDHMARDLHDTVAQVLGYASLQADATHKLLAEGRLDQAGGQLRRLADVARHAHAEVRRYIAELHEAPPERRPLADALRDELDRFAQTYGLDVSLSVAPGPDGVELAPGRQTELMRIVQEALTNARRHGDARQVQVTVEARDSWGTIVIEDDGRGFDAGALSEAPHAGHGLQFMRERVADLDGELAIDSAPGRGTRVVVRFPSEQASHAAPAREPVGAGRTVGSVPE